MKVILYSRVSTEEQARSGYGLDAQRATLQDAATARGWDPVWLADEGCSGSRINPALASALHLLRTKQADGLAVAKMDRLARSSLNAADIAATAKAQGWTLFILDIGLDLSTPAGAAMYNMLATFATFERDMVSARTKDALARAKARGVVLGRKSTIEPEVLRRIVAERTGGASFGAIARGLSADGYLSPAGRTVWPEVTVRRAFKRVTS